MNRSKRPHVLVPGSVEQEVDMSEKSKNEARMPIANVAKITPESALRREAKKGKEVSE